MYVHISVHNLVVRSLYIHKTCMKILLSQNNVFSKLFIHWRMMLRRGNSCAHIYMHIYMHACHTRWLLLLLLVPGMACIRRLSVSLEPPKRNSAATLPTRAIRIFSSGSRTRNILAWNPPFFGCSKAYLRLGKIDRFFTLSTLSK